MVEVGLMSKGQGFYGALDQYWSIQPKPRLHRRNTYFDSELSNAEALRFGLIVSVLAMAIICFWQLMVVLL